jgi:hypothetical protein
MVGLVNNELEGIRMEAVWPDGSTIQEFAWSEQTNCPESGQN